MILRTKRIKGKIIIQFVCEAHGEDIDELYHSGMLEEMETIDGQPLRYGLLAILLRIGDLMDIEETRVCELNMCLNPAYYGNRVSAEHNR